MNNEAAMQYRTLIASSLQDIGLDGSRIQLIDTGAMIYGDTGLLDSVHLVALIAALEERLSVPGEAPVSLFEERGFALLDAFKDVQTLVAFLEDREGSRPFARETYPGTTK
jgi:acyl carrier protein